MPELFSHCFLLPFYHLPEPLPIPVRTERGRKKGVKIKEIISQHLLKRDHRLSESKTPLISPTVTAVSVHGSSTPRHKNATFAIFTIWGRVKENTGFGYSFGE